MGATLPAWPRRAMLACLIRVTYVTLPLLVSVAGSYVLLQVAGVQELPTLFRWLLVLGASTVVLVLVHRGLSRLLPLAALLEMSVAFPGQAPSRYAVARDAGNVAKLREIVAKAQRGDPVVSTDDVEAAREILALVAALRTHDSRTRGHSERVRIFTDLIAHEMELPPEDREKLRWAALLHDVGKLKVPASVLNKPGTLNAAEWDLIRIHPDAGARLVAPLTGWLGQWSRTIADHHEKFDGTGYPRGLAGSDISLGGRILAVADSFEVMTAPRSYKKPMSREDALRELRRHALTQFDPQVVRAMLAVSAPRLRWAMGPLAWLASTPLALAAPAATSTIVMQTGAAALSLTTVAAVAPVHAYAEPPPSHLRPSVSTPRTAEVPVSKHRASSTSHEVATVTAPHKGKPAKAANKVVKPAKAAKHHGKNPKDHAEKHAAQTASLFTPSFRPGENGGQSGKGKGHGTKVSTKPSHHHDPHRG